MLGLTGEWWDVGFDFFLPDLPLPFSFMLPGFFELEDQFRGGCTK